MTNDRFLNCATLITLLLVILLLTSCGSSAYRSAGPYDHVNAELARAASDRKAGNDRIDQVLMPPLLIEMPKAENDAEVRFDLSVVKAPAAQVFMALVSGTRFSMLLPPDLSGNITVNLKDVTIKEALDTIRELYGYEYKVQGTRIFIQTNTLQSRVFQINYLSGRRQGSSNLTVSSSSITSSSNNLSNTGNAFGSTTGGITTGTQNNTASNTSSNTSGNTSGNTGNNSAGGSRVTTNSDADFWRDLTTALTAIVGTAEGRNVIINPMSGVVVVRAFPAEMRNVESYLKATQLVVERQVMIEAKIIEVTLSNTAQSGINWAAFKTISNASTMAGSVASGSKLSSNADLQVGNTLFGVAPGAIKSVTPMGNGFIGLAFQTANFAAVINFLETQGDVAVLSSPRIATLNNQKALLKVGTDEMFITNISGGTASTSTVAGVAPSLTLQPYFSGISLDVTPQIDDEGNIILHVHPAVSNVAEKVKVVDLGNNGGTMNLPLAASSINETDSIVRVQDGNIVAIGGLMRQSQTNTRSGLPGTANIGLVDGIFGQRSAVMSKSEMVILMKPTVINNDRVAQEDLLQTQSRIQKLNSRNY
ncbi:MAG: pilus (MSHA type) biogenesis protein MshL [Betaproteobacteria bacterium]|nr:pilus (MSHA type) biogenesis protein MshL [Betaproteobacteria bacterium]